MITQEQYLVCEQPTRQLFVEFNILNNDNRQIDSLVGVVTGGNLSIDAHSTHRRGGDIQLAITDSKYIPKPHSPIWFNNRCEIRVGLKTYTNDMVWFELGMYAFSNVSVEEGGTTTHVSCQLLDYMSLLDGTLGGTLTHQVLIKAGEVTIREAILGVLGKEFRPVVANITLDDKTSSILPYDIEKPTNTTKYEILREMVDLYAGYEMFFNTDGYFVVQKIPDYREDYPIQLFGEGSNFDFTVNSSHQLSFQDVKNEVVVWGYVDDKTGEQAKGRYCNRGVVKGFANLSQLEEVEEGDIYYVIQESTPYIYKEEQWTALNNMYVDPELSVEKIGLKPTAIDDNSIYSSEQAFLRARYELEEYNSLSEAISIESVPLYYLDINRIIYVNYKHIKGYCLITRINFGLDAHSLMNVEALRIWEGD